MNKTQNISIIGKRVNGSKIMYHLQKGQSSQWHQYNDLIEHLDLIIKYQKQRKRKLSGSKRTKTMPQQKNIQILDDEEQQKNQKMEQYKEIVNIVFSEKKNKNIFFKVFFVDGSMKILSNQILRKIDSGKLLDFYEKHIIVGYD